MILKEVKIINYHYLNICLILEPIIYYKFYINNIINNIINICLCKN